MKLEWLEIFMKLSPNKSLNQNSVDLFLSQQALSSIVKKIESEFGVPLILKSRTNGIQFTPTGLLLQQYCVDFFDKINALRFLSLQGEVNFGVMTNLQKGSFAQEISRFIKKNPKLNISFEYYADLQKAIADLKDGKFDILFSFELYLNDQIFFDNSNLYSDDICIIHDDVNPPQHYAIECHYEFLQKKSYYLKELSNYTCYINAPRDYHTSFLFKLFEKLYCTSCIKSEEIYDVYINQILQKNGYGLINATNTTIAKNIVSIPLKDNLISVPVYIIRANETSPTIKEILCQIQKPYTHLKDEQSSELP